MSGFDFQALIDQDVSKHTYILPWRHDGTPVWIMLSITSGRITCWTCTSRVFTCRHGLDFGRPASASYQLSIGSFNGMAKWGTEHWNCYRKIKEIFIISNSSRLALNSVSYWMGTGNKNDRRAKLVTHLYALRKIMCGVFPPVTCMSLCSVA